MKKQYYFVIVLALLVLASAFYWYELRPSSIKKDCFNKADIAKQNAINADNNVVMDGRLTITRADYDKIFKDEHDKCLMENGIK